MLASGRWRGPRNYSLPVVARSFRSRALTRVGRARPGTAPVRRRTGTPPAMRTARAKSPQAPIPRGRVTGDVGAAGGGGFTPHRRCALVRGMRFPPSGGGEGQSVHMNIVPLFVEGVWRTASLCTYVRPDPRGLTPEAPAPGTRPPKWMGTSSSRVATRPAWNPAPWCGPGWWTRWITITSWHPKAPAATAGLGTGGPGIRWAWY